MLESPAAVRDFFVALVFREHQKSPPKRAFFCKSFIQRPCIFRRAAKLVGIIETVCAFSVLGLRGACLYL